MCQLDRRRLLGGVAAAACLPATRAAATAPDLAMQRFVAEAQRMRAMAITSGDEPFGAVVVRDGEIVGFGPSRVVVDGNPDAHAERVALWDAQRRLATKDLTGAVIVSTSRPCSECQHALALARVSRMIYGADATDGGPPRPY